jgi:hypothetical protein
MKTQNPISQKEMGFFFFRAKKVILDKDPSRLYGIETQALKINRLKSLFRDVPLPKPL